MVSVLPHLHFSAGKLAARLFDMNKSPTYICIAMQVMGIILVSGQLY